MSTDDRDLLATQLERLAQAIHEQYVVDQEKRGRTPASNPSMVPWGELSETLKRSNRAQARNIPEKLEVVGCRVAPAGDEGPVFEFTDDELERLAEIEHDRWWLDQVIDGWTWGERKSDEIRTSPYLVGWSDLTEDIKDYDRDAVRALPELLAVAGLRIERLLDPVPWPPAELLAMLARAVPEIEKERPRFKELGLVLESILRDLVRTSASTAIVSSRPKAIASFVEKIVRKYPKYTDPMREMTDLCGVRVIVRTRTEVGAVSRLIEKNFSVDKDNSVVHNDQLRPSEFGYRSVHYIVTIPRSVDLGPEKDDLHDRKAEIQVRTVAEHAHADFGHDLSYKGAFALPDRWERELATIAAQVEAIDEAFVRIEDGLRVYATGYGAYLDLPALHREIATVRVMCDYAKDDPHLVIQLAQLLRASGDVKGAQAVLDDFCKRHTDDFTKTDLAQPEAAILRGLGEALCVRYSDGTNGVELTRGRNDLEVAGRTLAAAADRADTLATLGDSWQPAAKSREYYEEAYAADPVEPHALTRYLEWKIDSGGHGVVAMLKPAIDEAIARCRAQIEVGLNLPRAFSVIGELLMLQGDFKQGLDAYAKALRSSTDGDVVEDALRALDLLTKAPSTPEDLEWARRLLMLGAATRFGSPTRGVQLIGLASRDAGELFTISGPVVIVVGGTHPDIEPTIASYAGLMVEAFKDFTGTILSGGTEQGVSGLVGLVGTHDADYQQRIRTIGYLPDRLPQDGTATRDERYRDLRTTGRMDFSLADPLQMWIDLFASKIRPSDVKVLGINGGDVAAFEFRLALALGARVGVIQHTGREAEALLVDAEWSRLLGGSLGRGADTTPQPGTAQLVPLPDDSQTVRAFIGAGEPQLPFADRERIGRMVHEAFRARASGAYPSSEPAMRDFDSLPEYLRESNLQQADHIFAKLREIGYEVVPISATTPAFDAFDPGEVERLAEMEHGRWNAEKLAAGFVWGPEKSEQARTHPYLTSWDRLPDEVKDLDRDAVREIPGQLAAIGLTVTRP